MRSKGAVTTAGGSMMANKAKLGNTHLSLQMYIVVVRAQLREGGDIEKSAYLVNGASIEDVKRKLPYLMDLSCYHQFSIQSVKRVKPNCHLLWSRIEPSDSLQSRKNNSGQGDRKNQVGSLDPTNQPAGINVFAVGLVGEIKARSGAVALKKLGYFFMSKADGREPELPLFGNGQFIFEEVGPSDSTRIWNITERATAHHIGQSKLIAGGKAGG